MEIDWYCIDVSIEKDLSNTSFQTYLDVALVNLIPIVLTTTSFGGTGVF